jgi:hypothetical protein
VRESVEADREGGNEVRDVLRPPLLKLAVVPLVGGRVSAGVVIFNF